MVIENSSEISVEWLVSTNGRYLGGDDAPDSWQGSLKGLKYKIGGSFIEPDLSIKAHITTHNVRRKTYNAIGYIRGAVEPGQCQIGDGRISGCLAV